MNGLKYIRTRCNYSQRELADILGVSRQAVNMWENSKKIISDKRKKELATLFGIDDLELFEEISDDKMFQLANCPTYKVGKDNSCERFAFKPLESTERRILTTVLPPKFSEEISLSEKCELRRSELKKLFDEINEFTTVSGTKNSHDNMSSLNRTLKVFGNALDLLKETRKKYPECVMVYYHTFIALLDAMNIAYGLVEKEDVLNREPENKGIESYNYELYDYRNFSVSLSDIITEHLDNICDKVSLKRDIPPTKHRRKPVKD